MAYDTQGVFSYYLELGVTVSILSAVGMGVFLFLSDTIPLGTTLSLRSADDLQMNILYRNKMVHFFDTFGRTEQMDAGKFVAEYKKYRGAVGSTGSAGGSSLAEHVFDTLESVRDVEIRVHSQYGLVEVVSPRLHGKLLYPVKDVPKYAPGSSGIAQSLYAVCRQYDIERVGDGSGSDIKDIREFLAAYLHSNVRFSAYITDRHVIFRVQKKYKVFRHDQGGFVKSQLGLEGAPEGLVVFTLKILRNRVTVKMKKFLRDDSRHDLLIPGFKEYLIYTKPDWQTRQRDRDMRNLKYGATDEERKCIEGLWHEVPQSSEFHSLMLKAYFFYIRKYGEARDGAAKTGEQ